MLSRVVTFVVWALVAASGVFWGVRLLAQPSAGPAVVVAVGDALSASADVTRLLGESLEEEAPVAAAAPAVSSRFQLTGVMAPKNRNDYGLAVISIDGNPPSVYRVGAAIEGDLMLREVSRRTATLASALDSNNSASSFVLELPPLAVAATGVLPTVGFTLPQFRPQGAASP